MKAESPGCLYECVHMWNMFRQRGLEQNKEIIATERKVAVLNKQVTEPQTRDSLTWLNASQSISVVAFAKVIDSHHFKLSYSLHCRGLMDKRTRCNCFSMESLDHHHNITQGHSQKHICSDSTMVCWIVPSRYLYTPKTQGYWTERWLLQSPAASMPGPPNVQCALLDILIDCFIFFCLVCFSPLLWKGARKRQLKGGTALLWLLAREVQSLMSGRHASSVTSELGRQRGWLVVASLSSLKAKGEIR